MGTKLDKLARHIAKINKLLGVVGPYVGNHTITTGTLLALRALEDDEYHSGYAFTTNGVDRAINSYYGAE